MAKKQEPVRGEEHYQGQLALLRNGCRATGWAARRLLDIDEDAYAVDVVNRVYELLDQLDQLADPEQLADAVAYVTAGGMLLRYAFK